MSLFPQVHLAPFDVPAAAYPSFMESNVQEVQFKRPLAPSAKRKHAAMKENEPTPSNENRIRSNSIAAHVRSKTESFLFAPMDNNVAEPVSPIMKHTMKKARLSTDEIKVLGHQTSAPSHPVSQLPRPDIPLSFSFSGTRQEAVQLTEQFEKMKIQEDDENKMVVDPMQHPLLSKSAHIGSQSSHMGRKTLLEQESEERLNHVRQIKSVIGQSAADASQKVHLPILLKTSQPDLNCITPQTVVELLDGKYNEHYDAILIIDCRFDYEYDGGHIRGALNFPDNKISPSLEADIFDKPEYQAMGSRLCLVFHCEFSSHRGPRGYKKFRSLDRKKNAESYPHLDFPEMYLLEGGYRKFWEFEEMKSYCEPRGYVEMKADEYLDQCKEAMKPRGRSVSKVPAPIRRHFSMSCSNIFEGSGLNPEALKPLGAKGRLFEKEEQKDEQDVDDRLFSGARHNWTSR